MDDGPLTSLSSPAPPRDSGGAQRLVKVREALTRLAAESGPAAIDIYGEALAEVEQAEADIRAFEMCCRATKEWEARVAELSVLVARCACGHARLDHVHANGNPGCGLCDCERFA